MYKGWYNSQLWGAIPKDGIWVISVKWGTWVWMWKICSCGRCRIVIGGIWGQSHCGIVKITSIASRRLWRWGLEEAPRHLKGWILPFRIRTRWNITVQVVFFWWCFQRTSWFNRLIGETKHINNVSRYYVIMCCNNTLFFLFRGLQKILCLQGVIHPNSIHATPVYFLLET